MNYLLFTELAMTAAAAVSFVYGAVKYLRPHKPLYASMIVLGVGCIMIGRAHTLLRMISGLDTLNLFHVGMLGTVGAFAFFFSANFGQIDSIVDGGEKELLKYRIIALSGLVIPAVLYVTELMSPDKRAEKIANGFVAVAVAASSYFHVKHLLIPDIDYGIVRCQRGYNALALIYGILCMIEINTKAYGMIVPDIIVSVLECAVTLMIVPMVHRGVLKWSR
ncbi:MAG: hypothetical protein IK990_06650 [Ruminiclostridium sp.]|nr:hypothetical protein [Ruminiclostridium sp.]